MMRTITTFGLFVLIFGGLLHGQAFHRSITGFVKDDYLGWSVAGIADLDDDGVRDVLIGVPGFDGPTHDTGLVLVVSGKKGNFIHYFQGTTQGERFGASVAAVPDTNLDGYEDIAIGAPGFGPGSSTGAVHLYSGYDGAFLRGVTGSHSGAGLGESLASGFDLDQDGKGDVLAGEPGYNHGSLIQCGAVRLLSGADFTPFYLVSGVTAYDQLGSAVTLIEDMDGDGIPDGVGGMPGYDPHGLPGAGGAMLLSGTTGTTICLYEGIETFAGFGSALAALEDITGDGKPDLALGGPTAPVLSYINAGMVAFYSGPDTTPAWILQGNKSSQYFGRALSTAGLFDTDEVPDIAIGMKRPFDGAHYDGAVRIYAGSDGHFLTDLLPGPESDEFGFSIAAVGDIDEDGWEDVLVGDPFAGDARPQAGEARFYRGARPELTLLTTGKIGAPLEVHLRSFPSALALIMMDFNPGPTLTPFGIFELGFSASMIYFPTLIIPASGQLVIKLSIPDDPGLVGQSLYFQALVYHEGGFMISSSDHTTVIE
jgi:hypothetical protein